MRKVLDVLDFLSGIFWKIILLINMVLATILVALAKLVVSLFVCIKNIFNISSGWVVTPFHVLYVLLSWGFGYLSIAYNWILNCISASLILKRIILLLVLFVWLNFVFQPFYSFRTWTLYQNGIASYYGSGFYFKRTANGDIYWPWRISAASLSLPLGTLAKVVNRNNGDHVYVVINDRGPYVKGRILDLSTLAAFKLGMLKQGIVPVDIYIQK